ncbi:MAG: hypothetical protein K0Q74_1382 [Gammaproteobacteria bacterium]|jgi:hypothetical protein|nr:hypothetical protein [Gammaproteobacteria bacterium]
MIQFSHLATNLIKEYKVLTRRHFSPEESEQKFKELGIKGRLPKLEANLYRLLVAITQKMSKDYRGSAKNIRYSGGRHFLSHLRKTLKEYQLSGKKVIHVNRVVSRVVVKAVQLMSLPEEKLTDELYSELNKKAVLVAKHGEKEQKHVFKQSLQTNAKRNPSFFKPLKESYHRYLDEISEFLESSSDVLGYFS